MIFKHLHLWPVLVLIPLVIGLSVYSWKRRRRLLARMIDPSLWPKVLPTLCYVRRFWRHCLWVLAFICVCMAVLRPQFGLKFEKVVRKGQTIIIALDTSKSMDAKDVKPSRFDHAKREIMSFVSSLKGDQVGLLAFAGDAFVQCPLTSDYGAFRLFLDDIQVGAVSKPGTDIRRAIQVASQHFVGGGKRQAVLILLSDGESFGKEALEMANRAAKKGMVIYALGIGTLSGEPIPIHDDYGRIQGYKKDKNGEVVLSKLNDVALRRIAEATGGQYYTSNDRQFMMDRVYQALSRHEKAQLEERMFQLFHDQYHWPLGIAFLALFMHLLIRERKSKVA